MMHSMMMMMPATFVFVTLACSLFWHQAGCDEATFVPNKRLTFGKFQYGWNYQALYDQASRHLAYKRLNVEDADANIQETINWFEQEAAKTAFSFRKTSLLEAGRQLKSLVSIKDDTKCNNESLKILSANNKATRKLAHWPKNMNAMFMPRLARAVNHYFDQHAIACNRIYPSLLKEKLANLDSEKLRSVNELANGYIAGNRKMFPYKERKPFISYMPWIEGQDDETLRNSLREDSQVVIAASTEMRTLNIFEGPIMALGYLARDDQDREFLEKQPQNLSMFGGIPKVEGKIGILYRKYIMEPCQYYIDALKDFYSIVDFDHRMATPLIEDKEGQIELAIGRATFKICTDFVGKLRYKVGQRLEEIILDG